MNNQDDQTASSADSEAIYRTPTSDTGFAPGGDSLAAYIGPKNADYYEKVFDRFKNQGSSMSWNWPAFFVSSVWLLYRKMWLNAFFYWIVLPVVLGTISVVIALYGGEAASNLFYYPVYLLTTFLLLPMFANRLYYRHAQAKISKVATITSSAEQQSSELARIGGTSSIVLVVVPFFLVAVIGILAAIAIPAYQDYTIRAQVAEGLNLSGGAKAAVTGRFMDTGELAASNETAGIAPANRISGSYVSSVAIVEGDIFITYGNQAHTVISGKTIVLMPEQESASMLSWTCSSPSIAPKHLPASCR